MRELAQELKFQFQSYDQEQLNDAFIEACKNGNLESVKYLLTSPELNDHADIHAADDGGFHLACKNGHLSIVRYLLTSLELKEHADIHADNDGFQWACANGHLDVVKYLLTSPELNDHADIHAYDERGFQLACHNGHLDVVCYLLTSPELKEHADIHANDAMGFKWACENGHLDVVQYLSTFSGVQYVNFQKMDCDLKWAISEKYHDIVQAMITSLYRNDMIEYLENIQKIEQYCDEHGLDFKSWQEAMVKEDIDINSHTTELFV